MTDNSSTLLEFVKEVNTSFANGTRNGSECYHQSAFIIFQNTADDLILASSMAATVFNVMVIFCAVKLFKRSGDTMHLFITNMTMGDLILTIFCHPNELLIRKHSFLKVVHLCVVVHYFNWVGLAVSGLSLTLLNIDKLIYFRWPLSYDRTMSKKRAAIFCIAIWVITFGFISYCWLDKVVYIQAIDCSLQLNCTAYSGAARDGVNEARGQECFEPSVGEANFTSETDYKMNREKKFFYETFLLLFCVLPVSSSLIVSVYLFNLTRQKRAASSVGGTPSDSNTFSRKMKSLVFIFATTAWTFFSLLPYRLMNLSRLHLFSWHQLSCDDKTYVNWAAWILLYLLTLNPIVNPLITSLIYAPYRLTIKKFLVNIPGSRPLYAYREGSETSVRRSRGRRSSSADHELSTLRQSTEVVRMSVSEPPWTPVKDRTEITFHLDRPKSIAYHGTSNERDT